MIYFIAEPDDGPIKIGTTTNVATRLSSLQSANYRDLTLLGAIEGGYAEENLLHRAFCRNRIGREWFDRSDELMQCINDAIELGFDFVRPMVSELAKDDWGVHPKVAERVREIRKASKAKHTEAAGT